MLTIHQQHQQNGHRQENPVHRGAHQQPRRQQGLQQFLPDLHGGQEGPCSSSNSVFKTRAHKEMQFPRSAADLLLSSAASSPRTSPASASSFLSSASAQHVCRTRPTTFVPLLKINRIYLASFFYVRFLEDFAFSPHFWSTTIILCRCNK